MISFCAVDFEDNIIECNVEMHTTEESKMMEFGTKITQNMYLDLNLIPSSIGEISQGDILVVEHDNVKIIRVIKKDDDEKKRRTDFLSQILGE